MTLRSTFISTLLLGATLSACRTASKSEALENDQGPAATRPGWIKSPEAIEGTITQAWGINMSSAERWRYLQSMYSMLGGTLVLNTRSLVDQPNELFVMGLDNLSTWLADKLVDKQGQTTGSDLYLFEGLGFADADASNCFDNDQVPWCDKLDGVKVDSLSAANLTGASLPLAWQKRVMHNIQDIGEFMLLAIDNTLKMPGQERHAAQYLIDEVFLKTLEGQPLSAESERKAWSQVVYTILMSGGFYLEAPADNTPS